MEKLKTLPLEYLLTYIYPNLYQVHMPIDWTNEEWPKPLHLSFSNIERNGVYLLDTHDCIYMYICKSVNPQWLFDVFGITQWGQVPDDGDVLAGNASKPAPGQPNSTHPHAGQNGTASSLPEESPEATEVIPLPNLENDTSIGLRAFVQYLIDTRPFKPHFFILRYAFRMPFNLDD